MYGRTTFLTIEHMRGSAAHDWRSRMLSERIYENTPRPSVPSLTLTIKSDEFGQPLVMVEVDIEWVPYANGETE